jgi:hypothetical protein
MEPYFGADVVYLDQRIEINKKVRSDLFSKDMTGKLISLDNISKIIIHYHGIYQIICVVPGYKTAADTLLQIM